MKWLDGVLVVMLALVAPACAAGTASTGAAEPGASAPAAVAAIGAPAPAFTLKDQNGNSVSLADFTGKVVVLEWINPDCPFVQRHARMKTMDTLERKYHDKGVVWLGINSTSYMGATNNAAWAKDNGLEYSVLDDHDGAVGRAYAAKTTPHMYVIDTTGKLVYEGAIDSSSSDDKSATNYVDAALTDVLAGRAVAAPQTKPYGCSVKYKSN